MDLPRAVSVDLFQTGTLVRCPGGNVENAAEQKANGVRWAALNIGSDPCVNHNPSVWQKSRAEYASAGVPVGPWMHCHSLDDVIRVLDVGVLWDADFVGINIEDVVGDKLSLQEIGGYLLDFWVNKYGKPVHMPSLPWLENGQGWQYVDFCTIALEMFPEVDPRYLADWQGCVNHAFAEGAKRVTLLYSTQSARVVYPPAVAHCLYTADNVTDWPEWKDTVPQVPPVPPKEEPPVKLTPTQKKKVRAAFVVYCERAEQWRMNRGYSQRRPGLGYGLSAKGDQLDDCSMFVSKVAYKGMQVSGIHLIDPLGFHFSGIGNTESIQATVKHEAPVGKYLVGDIALWGPNDFDTSHTAICRKAGTAQTAIFTSHGHQSWRFSDDAPEPIKLPDFPEHLIGVFRMDQLR